MLLDTEHRFCERLLQRMHTLGLGVERVASRLCVVVRDHRARLDRIDHHAAVDDVHGADARRAGECGFDRARIALLPIEAALAARAHVGAGIQRLVIDLDELGGVAGDLGGACNHEGDTVANVAHHRFRERGAIRRLHR